MQLLRDVTKDEPMECTPPAGLITHTETPEVLRSPQGSSTAEIPEAIQLNPQGSNTEIHEAIQSQPKTLKPSSESSTITSPQYKELYTRLRRVESAYYKCKARNVKKKQQISDLNKVIKELQQVCLFS